MSLLIAPHNDDEALFASYIILRYRPLVVVVTDSYKQAKRGQDITWQQRRIETTEAMRILGAAVMFLGIPDDELTYPSCLVALKGVYWKVPTTSRLPACVFAPACQGGNAEHDLISNVCSEIWEPILYATYAKDEWFTPIEGMAIHQTEVEAASKRKALACYKSQHFQPHFKAVEGQPEYLSRLP